MMARAPGPSARGAKSSGFRPGWTSCPLTKRRFPSISRASTLSGSRAAGCWTADRPDAGIASAETPAASPVIRTNSRRDEPFGDRMVDSSKDRSPFGSPGFRARVRGERHYHRGMCKRASQSASSQMRGCMGTVPNDRQSRRPTGTVSLDTHRLTEHNDPNRRVRIRSVASSRKNLIRQIIYLGSPGSNHVHP